MLLSFRNEEKAGLIIGIIIRSDPIRKTEDHKKDKKATKKDKKHFIFTVMVKKEQ